MGKIHIRWEYKLADCWIGVFWKRTDPICIVTHAGEWNERRYRVRSLEIWICLVPCFPIHLTWVRPC